MSLPPYFGAMPAKMTPKNRLTLPKRAVDAFGNPSHFEVEANADRLVLTPARRGVAGDVRRKLAPLGLANSDVANAVAWARNKR